MKKQRSVFRKVSIDRLSSPEQLDQKLTMVSPAGWIALVSFAFLIGVALIWSIFGTINNKATGHGLLKHESGIAAIVSHTNGRITDLPVREGQKLEKDQIIARVDQDELLRRIGHVENNLIALEAIDVDTLSFDIFDMNSDIFREFLPLADQIRNSREQFERQLRELENNTEQHEDRILSLNEQIESMEKQIGQYKSLLNFQRQMELENAQWQQWVLDNTPSAVAAVNNDPMFNQIPGMQTQLKKMKADLKDILDSIAALDPNNPDEAALIDALRAEEAQLRSAISNLNGSINQLQSQRNNALNTAHAQDRQTEAARHPGPLTQVRDRPGFDNLLSQMHSQLEGLKQQLRLAELQEAQGIVTFLDFLAGDNTKHLIKQFEEQKFIRELDLLRNLSELEDLYERDSVIRAEFAGTIVGLAISQRDFVQPGSNIGNIIIAGETNVVNNVMLYMPVEKGTLVTVGMDVNISPTTTNREEHGFIKGIVRSVSPYAVSQESMMATLRNQQFVQMFGGQSAVLELEVELLLDPSTVSGYAWSTPKGAPFAIIPGTICSGEVTVSSQRPIEMIIPFLKRLFTGDAG